MSPENLAAKIGSIEAQLQVLKSSNRRRTTTRRGGGLRALKGALKGQGNFSDEELREARIEFRKGL